MTFELDLTGQVVLVTGGTSGIGLAVVEAMLSANARVAFCAPSQSECDDVARALDENYAPDRVFGIASDLHDRKSLIALVEQIRDRWAPIDTLVCNAADFGQAGTIDELDLDVFSRVLQANVVNNFLLCSQVIPGMVKRGTGSIIMMTSITGYTAMPSNVPYAASKAAIASMARSLAAEYASQGIRVNCVSPGLIKTEASRPIWGSDTTGVTYIAEKIPAQRIGVPEDVAPLCVFLASDHSRYITAATLPVDGGRLGIGQPTGLRAPEGTRN